MTRHVRHDQRVRRVVPGVRRGGPDPAPTSCESEPFARANKTEPGTRTTRRRAARHRPRTTRTHAPTITHCQHTTATAITTSTLLMRPASTCRRGGVVVFLSGRRTRCASPGPEQRAFARPRRQGFPRFARRSAVLTPDSLRLRSNCGRPSAAASSSPTADELATVTARHGGDAKCHAHSVRCFGIAIAIRNSDAGRFSQVGPGQF